MFLDGRGPRLCLRPFKLERYFAEYEFNPAVKYLACCSDSEPFSMEELVEFAANSTDRHLFNLWHGLSLGYTESTGLPELREQISKTHYTSLDASNILVAAPQEAIFLAMNALLRPGDKVICMYPAYQSLYEVATAIGAEVLLWNSRTIDGVAAFDVADLEKVVTAYTAVKLIIVNAPHNPTGWLPSLAEWGKIRECCAKSTYPGGAYLFSDEMYRTLERDPRDRLPPGVDFMPPGRGISLCGLSKSVGMPGLRIGWLATSDTELLRAAAALKDYTTICSSAPSEVLALIALKNWDKIIERQLGIIEINLEILEEYVAGEWKEVLRWKAPKAGTIGYGVLKLPEMKRLEQTCRLLAEEYGVLLLPATVYDDDEAEDLASGMGRVRIGYGRKNLPEALKALDAAFRALKML